MAYFPVKHSCLYNNNQYCCYIPLLSIQLYTDQPAPQALRFLHVRSERETLVTGNEPQGTMGKVQTGGESCVPFYSGLVNFVPESRLPFVQISSIF